MGTEERKKGNRIRERKRKREREGETAEFLQLANPLGEGLSERFRRVYCINYVAIYPVQLL